MGNTTIKRAYEISCAHQLEGHPKCGRIHGHNYVIDVEVSAEVGAEGWIMDFGVLDARVVKPTLDMMDHMYLVSNENVLSGNMFADMAINAGQAFVLGTDRSTAERISEFLAREFFVGVAKMMPLFHVSVTVHETSRSSATSTCYFVNVEETKILLTAVEATE
jgi:6-pyruvoyl tetrahydropterin synthase/QueD family protein